MSVLPRPGDGVVVGRDLVEEALAAGERDMSGLILTGADLEGVDLTGCVFARAWLDEVRFTGANLSGVSLAGAQLQRASLEGAVLVGADLSGVSGQDVSMRDADVKGALLVGAALPLVELTGADLSGADLSGARLNGMNASGLVDLSRAVLMDTTWTFAEFAVPPRVAGAVFSAGSLRQLVDALMGTRGQSSGWSQVDPDVLTAGQLEALVTLAHGWEGSVGDLVKAASALSRPVVLPGGVPDAGRPRRSRG